MRNWCLWTRNPSASGCRYPAFYRVCACPSLSWGTRKGGGQTGPGGGGLLTTETFLRAGCLRGSQQSPLSNSHNQPADKRYRCQRPNPTEEEPGAPSAAHTWPQRMEGRHSGRQGDAALCPWSPAFSPHTLSRKAHGCPADANQSPQWGPDGCEPPLLGSAFRPAGGVAPGECLCWALLSGQQAG